jgi:hypothetical protein
MSMSSRAGTVRTNRINAGDILAGRDIVALSGRVIVPDDERLVHLQFRRFAGCPVCNLHLRAFERRHGEIVAARVREVVAFHSSPENLLPHVADLPFDVIADPEKRLYAEFGVESSPRSLLDPRVWGTIVRAVLHSLVGIVREGRPVPSLNPEGGRFGLPADFLIAPSGLVLACKYGAHADDQWTVDEMLGLARRASAPAGGGVRDRRWGGRDERRRRHAALGAGTAK